MMEMLKGKEKKNIHPVKLAIFCIMCVDEMLAHCLLITLGGEWGVGSSPQQWEVKGVKVMNFYGAVPCVSGLSHSPCAALPLKDTQTGQFVLPGPREWACLRLKYHREHTHIPPHWFSPSTTVVLR